MNPVATLHSRLEFSLIDLSFTRDLPSCLPDIVNV